MPCLTTKALQKELKAARKELRAAERKIHWRAFLNALLFSSHDHLRLRREHIQAKKQNLQVYNIEKTLAARRNALQTYKAFRKGTLTKRQAQFAYLQYCYFKEKLAKQR